MTIENRSNFTNIHSNDKTAPNANNLHLRTQIEGGYAYYRLLPQKNILEINYTDNQITRSFKINLTENSRQIMQAGFFGSNNQELINKSCTFIQEAVKCHKWATESHQLGIKEKDVSFTVKDMPNRDYKLVMHKFAGNLFTRIVRFIKELFGFETTPLNNRHYQTLGIKQVGDDQLSLPTDKFENRLPLLSNDMPALVNWDPCSQELKLGRKGADDVEEYEISVKLTPKENYDLKALWGDQDQTKATDYIRKVLNRLGGESAGSFCIYDEIIKGYKDKEVLGLIDKIHEIGQAYQIGNNRIFEKLAYDSFKRAYHALDDVKEKQQLLSSYLDALEKFEPAVQEVREDLLAFIEKELGLSEALKHLPKLDVKNTASMEKRVFEELGLEVYLNNIQKFTTPNKKVRRQVTKMLLTEEGRQFSSLAVNLKLGDHKLLSKILLQDESLRQFLDKNEIEINSTNVIVFASILFQKSDGIDVGILESAIDSLKKHKEMPELKEYMQKYLHIISEDQKEKCIKLIGQIYPASVPGNSIFYPSKASVGIAYDEFGNDIAAFEIYTSEISAFERPQELLHELCSRIETSADLMTRLKIHFYNNPGMDSGGLGAQFITDLMRGLTTNSKIKFEKKHHFLLPSLNEKLKISGEEALTYRDLGKLFGFLLQSNPSYPIGNLFDMKFFQTLISFSEEELKMSPEEYQQKLADMNMQELDRYCSIYAPVHDGLPFEIRAKQEEAQKNLEVATRLEKCVSLDDLNPEDKQYIEAISFEEITEENFEEEKRTYLESQREYYLTAMNTFIASHSIASGLNQCLPITLPNKTEGTISINNWDNLSALGAENIGDRIQGKLSKDTLKASTESEDQQVLGWFNEWVDLEETTDDMLKSIVLFITGSPTIPEGVKLKLTVSTDFVTFVAHTCFNRWDIPKKTSKEDLFTELKSIAGLKTSSINIT